MIAKHLHNLMKNTDNFTFDEEEQNSFNTLKGKLLEAPILGIYSPTAETELHCDASSHGYSSVLL